MFVKVNALPLSVRQALELVHYSRADIAVEPAETVCVQDFAGDGCRAFYCAFALDGSAVPRLVYGSWGGPNPFAAPQPDVDDRRHPIPIGCACITGVEGGGRPVRATLHVHPEAIAPLLPAPDAEMTDRLRRILAQFRGLTSAGRKDEWRRFPESKPTETELETLVFRGYLARNKAGAVSITTAGKNACQGVQVY